MRARIFSWVAGLVTFAGLVLGIMTVPPSDWIGNLRSWGSVIAALGWILWPLVLGFLAVCIGLLVGRYLIPHGHPTIIRQNIEREAVFSDRLQDLIKREVVHSIDIMSYTAETLQDVLTYDFRNQAGITFRILTRSWQEEEIDQKAYNGLLANSGRRRWNKADAIRSYAQSPWTYLGQRKQRFYVGIYPFAKLMIVRFNRKVLGFLSFYDFQEWPPNGGSPFKGSTSLGYILDSDDALDAEMLERLQHQFEFVWQYRSISAENTGRSTYKSVFAAAKSKPQTD